MIKKFGTETTRDNTSPLAQTEQADQAILKSKQTGGLKGPTQNVASALEALLGFLGQLASET